jgi:hypothetical protein
MAHRICRLIWLPFHRGVRYGEHGPAVQESSKPARTTRMIRQLRNLGYRVETAGTEPCIGSEEISALLGTRQKGPAFGPALFLAAQLKVLRTPAAAQAAGRAVRHRRC